MWIIIVWGGGCFAKYACTGSATENKQLLTLTLAICTNACDEYCGNTNPCSASTIWSMFAT